MKEFNEVVDKYIESLDDRLLREEGFTLLRLGILAIRRLSNDIQLGNLRDNLVYNISSAIHNLPALCATQDLPKNGWVSRKTLEYEVKEAIYALKITEEKTRYLNYYSTEISEKIKEK